MKNPVTGEAAIATLAAKSASETAVAKISRRFIPIIFLCYLVLYLDRLNVGTAALTMNQDLGLTPSIYGLIAGVFFWTYSLFEIPSNYFVGRWGVRAWVARIIVSWGLVTIATAVAQGVVSLLVLRLLLGTAEAGFSPAVMFFIAYWFPAKNRAAMMALAAAAVPVAGLSTPLMTGVLSWMDGLGGLQGWRWLFIVTGIPAVLLGLVFYRVIRNRPQDTTFLTSVEIESLSTAHRADGNPIAHSGDRFRDGLLNPRVLILVVVFVLFTFSLFGFQFFLPLVLKGFGWSTPTVGWAAALPPLLALAPMLLWSRHSDRTNERPLHFAAAAVMAAAGFAVAAVFFATPAAALIGLCIAGIGLYTCIPLQLSIPTTFLTGAALAAGLATINGLGNIGGYFGPQVTGLIHDATGSYRVAIAVMAATLVVAGAVAALVGRTLRQQNRIASQ